MSYRSPSSKCRVGVYRFAASSESAKTCSTDFYFSVYSTICVGGLIVDMRTPEKIFPHMSVFAYWRFACHKPATTLRSLRPTCYRSFPSPRPSTRQTGRGAYRRRASRFSIRGMGEPRICYHISIYQLMWYCMICKENTRRAVFRTRRAFYLPAFMTGLEQGNSNRLLPATRIREPSFVPLPVMTGYVYYTEIQRACR